MATLPPEGGSTGLYPSQVQHMSVNPSYRSQPGYAPPVMARQAPVAADSLPLGWEERPHPSGQSQYYNIRTQELTWAKPQPFSAPAPAPAVAVAALRLAQPAQTKPADASITDFLREARLAQFEPALREMGAAFGADVIDVEDSELLAIGMKKIEIKRLRRFQ